MRQRRVVLVQLPAPVVQAGSASGNVPLAAGCLGVAVDRAGLQDSWKVEVLHPSQGDHLGDTSLVDWIVRQQPDLLGFSLYLWNVERSLALAERVRGQVPGIHIVGGVRRSMKITNGCWSMGRSMGRRLESPNRRSQLCWQRLLGGETFRASPVMG